MNSYQRGGVKKMGRLVVQTVNGGGGACVRSQLFVVKITTLFQENIKNTRLILADYNQ